MSKEQEEHISSDELFHFSAQQSESSGEEKTTTVEMLNKLRVTPSTFPVIKQNPQTKKEASSKCLFSLEGFSSDEEENAEEDSEEKSESEENSNIPEQGGRMKLTTSPVRRNPSPNMAFAQNTYSDESESSGNENETNQSYTLTGGFNTIVDNESRAKAISKLTNRANSARKTMTQSAPAGHANRFLNALNKTDDKKEKSDEGCEESNFFN